MSKEVMDSERLKNIRHLLVTLDGQDPEAQQTLNEFLKFNNNVERTNLPTRRDVWLISYSDAVSKTFFPERQDNPFAVLVNSIAEAFMAKGGDKSKQFVELMKNVPTVVDLQSAQGEPKQRGLMDKILGRKGEE